jgi:hypothetical protein
MKNEQSKSKSADYGYFSPCEMDDRDKTQPGQAGIEY